MTKVLVAEDKRSLNEFLCEALTVEGYQIISAFDGQDALSIIRTEKPDIVLTDIKMPGMSGLDLLRDGRSGNSPLFIIMTAYGTVESAVEAMKLGAFDYITKPVGIDHLLITLDKACKNLDLLIENRNLRQELQTRYKFDNIVGSSSVMQSVFEMVSRIIDSRSNVIIYGESGTGKELIARAIHYSSPRKDKPFIKVNCAAIPENLLESELFGHERGAFTGAISKRTGRFEMSHTGTIFLDEIGEISQAMQVKLLRVLQTKEFERVGGGLTIKVDVRIIAATNRDLGEMTKRGEFREDLYYRLNVVPITLPPLRKRREDIPFLVEHFVRKISRDSNMRTVRFSPEAMSVLMRSRWTGNVRELENVIERTMVLASGDYLGVEDLPDYLRENEVEGDIFKLPPGGISLNEAVEILERRMILDALERNDWIQTRTADELGLNRGALIYKMKKYGLSRPMGASEEI
ncbi:MAG: DNA-binding response regulator [Candidatus Wallbacteria bacterium HGW-Wallbacteria-1]|jgi:DNA-binding NtrC family response regulator|uniref:DNA-binding response regulator n=1 Tax=Candidatus Wallbacteria bacterium HGW-Wallbacteria-1 TaxID=2013854 RepID=A0A2N1PVE6_9BACT|nr:MAG: DNA-binding response regulator [Candidatus Wallbacteria bacterium HGW-Wallbacteria-1]